MFFNEDFDFSDRLSKMRIKGLSLVLALISLTIMLVPSVFAASCDGVTLGKKIICDTPTSGLQLYTYYEWLVQITVHNLNSFPITDVTLKDRFGAEFGVDIVEYSGGSGGAAPVLSTIGASAKVFLDWYIGTLGPDESAVIKLHVYTDINPGGNQEFTSCDCYEMNSGAVVKWLDDLGKKHSLSTGSLVVSTF